MKTIGLIGGIVGESSSSITASSMKLSGKTRRAAFGKMHLLLVDFAEIEAASAPGQVAGGRSGLIGAAQSLESAGAELIVVCTHTMHKVADDIPAHTHIPLLHIADATAQQVKASGIRKVGLLGTRFTMEEDFTGQAGSNFGLDVIIPDAQEREIVHRVIYDELVLDIIRQASKDQYLGIIEHLVELGAEGVILGCTEIGMLIHPEDCQVPFFDTTRIHAEAAAKVALAE